MRAKLLVCVAWNQKRVSVVKFFSIEINTEPKLLIQKSNSFNQLDSEMRITSLMWPSINFVWISKFVFHKVLSVFA